MSRLEQFDCVDNTISGALLAGRYGRARDLQRLITYEKLKGTLHEIIYSMEAAQIDFYPYQFKPVLKLVSSPTERLIIADEVGLGKTIESALIWLELQARRNAKRLLVVCPRILAEKWRQELREKFLLNAQIVDFKGLSREFNEFKQIGPGHSFVLIATYTGLRPPKKERAMLDDPPGEGEPGSKRTALLRELRHGVWEQEPFDLVIFDEAHYMRNPETTTFHLGEGLAAGAASVLCVSATPINNSNVDLHSLLRFVDESFFESQPFFQELLDANRPAVQAGNALARIPFDAVMVTEAVEKMNESKFISGSPLFKQFVKRIKNLDPADRAALAKAQDLAEKLNLLGSYVNRTRRVQVKEHRPVRDPRVLAIAYTREEMLLYSAILRLVRFKCRQDSRPFHIFQVLGLQLRAASCLPVIASEIRSGRLGDPEELLSETFDEDTIEELLEEQSDENFDASAFVQLLNYDFEDNDSKYAHLRDMLKNLAMEKVLIFAYYRPTLAYLHRRLVEDGISVAMIHGGVEDAARWKEIDRFRDPEGPRVLLSSEVGSEGIDLQFCRVMVNYDLPWNPMRVEQRIGRIDRVGQEAKRLSIANFKIRDTVEERLYDRLHSKLERFANSLGDLEPIIGEEVQRLTIDLLSKELTPEQERIRMDQTEQVIEQRLLHLQALEDSGDVLVALSDYLQRRVEEDRGRGRYVLPEELYGYVTDFFEREFQGCEVNQDTPVPGCLRIRLTAEARASLNAFIGNDQSLGARPLRQQEFAVTFDRALREQLPPGRKKQVHFINHLSPLIRWITKMNKDRAHALYAVSALRIKDNELKAGPYVYLIERWKMHGLTQREQLVYGVIGLSDERPLKTASAEEAIQRALRTGRDWLEVDLDPDIVLAAYKQIEDDLTGRFARDMEDFDAENATALQIRVQRVKGFYERRVSQDEQRLETLRLATRKQSVIHATEARIRIARENCQNRLRELDTRAKMDAERSPVASGVFLVEP